MELLNVNSIDNNRITMYCNSKRMFLIVYYIIIITRIRKY